MTALKPYRKENKDFIDTVNDIISTLEQTKDLLQNIQFDMLRVKQSNSGIRTSLDEINYIFEKFSTQLVLPRIKCLKTFVLYH